jgi:transcriptional regulator with XRE-family HTH domain
MNSRKPRLNLKAASGPFAEFVKRRRIEAGLTQHALAEVTGLSFAFIQDVERGSVHLQLHKLISLLEFLGGKILVQDRVIGNTEDDQIPTARKHS